MSRCRRGPTGSDRPRTWRCRRHAGTPRGPCRYRPKDGRSRAEAPRSRRLRRPRVLRWRVGEAVPWSRVRAWPTSSPRRWTPSGTRGRPLKTRPDHPEWGPAGPDLRGCSKGTPLVRGSRGMCNLLFIARPEGLPRGLAGDRLGRLPTGWSGRLTPREHRMVRCPRCGCRSPCGRPLRTQQCADVLFVLAPALLGFLSSIVSDKPSVLRDGWLSLTVFVGEFDPGSGRTLAACLTHASRAVRPFGVHERRTGE